MLIRDKLKAKGGSNPMRNANVGVVNRNCPARNRALPDLELRARIPTALALVEGFRTGL